MLLVLKTINVLLNNMQLTLSQTHKHLEMNNVQLSSELNQIYVFKLLRNIIKKISASLVSAESSEIMSAYFISNFMKIDMQKRSESFQIINALYDNF